MNKLGSTQTVQTSAKVTWMSHVWQFVDLDLDLDRTDLHVTEKVKYLVAVNFEQLLHPIELTLLHFTLINVQYS